MNKQQEVTIYELNAKLRELELAIKDQLNQFQEETGCVVADLQYRHVHTLGFMPKVESVEIAMAFRGW